MAGLSDNSLANLLLQTIGGPEGVTRHARSIGDGVTRLDRTEPALNTAEPGDRRDTTTPAAMLADLRTILFGEVLTAPSRQLVADWLVGNTTGNGKLRAGLPASWRVGDKTGMGGHGSTDDIAVAWPPGRSPVVIAAYLVDSPNTLDDRNAALAAVGRLVADL